MAPVSGAQTATGRPARLPRSARRKQLLAAAQEVFVAQGYHAAAMDDIAERAGVSKPVLYQHFPGKLDLYLALLDTHCDAIVERVRDAMKATTDNKERVDGCGRRRTSTSSTTRARLSGWSSSPTCATNRRSGSGWSGSSGAAPRRSPRRSSSDTGVSRSRAELLAAGLCGASEIAARFWLASGRKVPKPEAVSLVAALNWRGIAGLPAAERRAWHRGSLRRPLRPELNRAARALAVRPDRLAFAWSPASVADASARRDTVEVKIGVQYAPRELVIESAQAPADIAAAR